MTSATHVDVPLLDLKAQYATIRSEIEPAVQEVLESQVFIGGPKVAEFECRCAGYLDVPYTVGNSSGSDALILALDALGVGPGDEVIVPTYTFFSTAGSVSRVGATPVFVDIDPTTYQIDPDSIRRVLAGRKPGAVKALMPVHLFGQAADLDAIMAIADEHDLRVVEDAAQAFGTEDVRGRRVGSVGDIGTFSFFPSKNLGGFGDGGLCTTRDEALAEEMIRFRNHGMKPKYFHHDVGLNARLDALQAAILLVKIEHLDAWSAGRQANATWYDEAFAAAGAATSAVSLDEGGLPLRTPEPAPEGARHIYNQYVLRVPGAHRDALRETLKAARIGNEVYYPRCLHQQDCYRGLGYVEGDFPHSERASRETIAIPIYPELSEGQKQYVVDTVLASIRAI
ncbi:MAG: DegT/DnrJ/EryC1/StrS family aminotransferase [Phycisphaerales bacterium]|nr:DegT/DnrJ/EryC1/StrS family aminotransferase [Phycisphaerales bacterium]